MRTLTAICLTLLLLLTVSGRSFVFRLRIAEVRASMRQQIEEGTPAGSVTVFQFDSAEEARVRWLEDRREFDLGAERYDVLKTERRNGLLLVHCVSDKKESALVAEHFKEEGGTHSPAHQLLKLLNQPFLPAASPVPILTLRRVTTTYPPLAVRLETPTYPIPTPPPQSSAVHTA